MTQSRQLEGEASTCATHPGHLLRYALVGGSPTRCIKFGSGGVCRSLDSAASPDRVPVDA